MNKRVISIVVGVLALIALAGCSGPGPVYGGSPAETPTAPPSALDTPTPIPTLLPTATLAPTAALTVVPTPQPYPTPVGPPYTDAPFTIVFQRGGELWMNEVGGRGEWQLTHEGPEWATGMGEFAISPDRQNIAFVAGRTVTESLCVKLVRVEDGATRVLAGEDDPYEEFNVMWWDATHVAFQISPFLVPGHANDSSVWEEIQPYALVIVDIETGERVTEAMSSILYLSPNGRYALSGHPGDVRPESLPYQLQDRETGEQWAVTEDNEATKFLSWSPDSRWMLFGLSREGEGPDTLLVVDVEAHTRRVLTPAGKTVCIAAWSPDSRSIAYPQCGLYDCGGPNCELWLTAPDGSNQRTIPASISDFYIERMAWTPDGSRLVLNNWFDNHVWSVRVDGTDLRLIAGGQRWFQVLPSP
jgi:predicted small lipoprotein YifL